MSLEYGVANDEWDDERWARAALSFVCEPSSAAARSLADTPAIQVLADLRMAQMPAQVRDRGAIQKRLRQLPHPAGVLIPGDSGWPTQLDALAEPPLALWWRGGGSLRELCATSVAVVGARQATQYGDRMAVRISADLAGAGWTVVSGGAFGIDAAAHRGALTEGSSVCVLACGIDVAYPAAHSGLLERIAADGVLVSESALGEPARRYRFLARNRLIAALSRGTVVVEAAYRSGSLGTARRALELGRVVMGLPGPVTSSASLGVLELLRTDPRTHLVTCAADVLELCGTVGEHMVPARDGPKDRRDEVSEFSQRVLDHLGDASNSVARLAARLQCTQLMIIESLTELAVAGLAEFDGVWRVTSDGLAPAAR